MEIKFDVLVQDQYGKQNVACSTSTESMKKLLDVLLTGIDPNHLSDFVIHPVIKQ